MMTMLIGIYGAGGCGRGIMPLARQMQGAQGVELVFIDDAGGKDVVNGHEVLSFEQFLAHPQSDKQVALAVAQSKARKLLAGKCEEARIPVMSVWAKDAILMDEVEIGEGALVSPQVVFTSNIRVGRCFHANIRSTIEHDCVIGEFVTFALGVCCNGNVTIGDHAYIGSGATIRQGITIGDGAVVGMGAVVVRDIEPGEIVVGNPARPIERN